MAKKKRLVLGIGNDILMDDGIGIKLVDYLKEEMNHPGVEFEKANLGGLEILEFIQGYETVLFIDAIKTRDGVPGDIYQFTPEDFKETLHLSNLHDVSFLTALELGKQMKLDIPTTMRIIAIEIIEDKIFGVDFTPPLQARYPAIQQEVKEIAQSLLTN